MNISKTIIFSLFTVLNVFFLSTSTYGQVREGRGTRPPIPDRDVNEPRNKVQPGDSLLHNGDSTRSATRIGDIETTINYFAKDSIITSVDTRIVKLYGDAKIIYGDIELQANFITIDYNTQQLFAEGHVDSLGRRVGFPIFKNGAEVYETRDITYNFKTGRARIKEVVTTQGDGFIHGNTVFKNERDEILSIGNSYTTCNLAEPHFRIRSSRTKAIPNDKIVSGPFHLEIMGVPTPLGFPFGIFPSPRKSASGIIPPQYGEEARRGFFLRNGGYFFDISEYFKLSVTGDIYSRGSYGINLASNYSVRYRHSGNLNFSVNKNKTTDLIEAPTSVTDFRISWSHSPMSRGTGKFSASVNAATATYSQNNFLGVNYDLNSTNFDNTTRKLNSSISYTKQLRGTPFSFGVSARHNQDIVTNRVDLQLPEFYATMRSIYPLKNVSDADIFKKLNIRYNLKSTNRVTNNLGKLGDATTDSIAPFNMNTLPQLLENSRKGIRHSLPVSTSFKLKYFNVNPSLNLDETWYFEKLHWKLNEDGTKVEVQDTIRGFNRMTTYGASVSLNTRIYGTYLFNKGNVQAIRHVINPSISYNFTPDFGEEKFDYYQKFTLASGYEQYKSRHDGFVYGSARLGESQALGFSLGNTLEMKVVDKADSSERENPTKKVSLLRSLSFSSSYNFVADSFNLAPISIRTNTALFDNKLTVSMGGTVDPYTYVLDSVTVNETTGINTIYQRRINEFSWKNGQRLGQISRANLSLSTNLNPRKRAEETSSAEKIMNSSLSEADKAFLLNNPDSYVDFDIPWSFRINYNLSYAKTGYRDPVITQSVTFSGDLSLSEKWKVGMRSGYDFKNKEFTTSNVTISRDLHCWELNLNWVPFGRFTSYNFVIRVKSSLLSDLKINRKRSFFDR